MSCYTVSLIYNPNYNDCSGITHLYDIDNENLNVASAIYNTGTSCSVASSSGYYTDINGYFRYWNGLFIGPYLKCDSWIIEQLGYNQDSVSGSCVEYYENSFLYYIDSEYETATVILDFWYGTSIDLTKGYYSNGSICRYLIPGTGLTSGYSTCDGITTTTTTIYTPTTTTTTTIQPMNKFKLALKSIGGNIYNLAFSKSIKDLWIYPCYIKNLKYDQFNPISSCHSISGYYGINNDNFLLATKIKNSDCDTFAMSGYYSDGY